MGARAVQQSVNICPFRYGAFQYIVFDLSDIPGAICDWRNVCMVLDFSGKHDVHPAHIGWINANIH
jgi:hypothetical protein